MEKAQALPIVDSLRHSIGNFQANMWQSLPFHDWPYWRVVVGLVVTLVLFFFVNFFYQRFWRKSSGELPKGYKIKEG